MFPGLGGAQATPKGSVRTPRDRISQLTRVPPGIMRVLLQLLSAHTWKVRFQKEMWFPDSTASPRGSDQPGALIGTESDPVFTA